MGFIFRSNRDEVVKRIKENKEKALEAVGIFIEGEAKVRCPVLTGNLKGSYTHQVEARDDKVLIGSPVEYAIWVEKGTKKSAKQPHLTPAAEDNLKRIENLVRIRSQYHIRC